MRSHSLMRHCLCVFCAGADTATATCWTRWGHCTGTRPPPPPGCPAGSCNTPVCHATITCDSLPGSNACGLVGELLKCVCVCCRIIWHESY